MPAVTKYWETARPTVLLGLIRSTGHASESKMRRVSALGFLLAPLREIPAARDDQWMATVEAWIDVANGAWFALWEALPADQQEGAPRMPPGRGLTSSAVDPGLKKDPQIAGSARSWAERAWTAWHDSGRTGPLPLLNSAAAHEALECDSRMSLQDLTGYAGGFAEIAPAKLKRGGRHAFLKNEGDPNAFPFGLRDGTQKELFLEIARGHGGDHLAVWTFGHSLHVLVARSTQPGARPTLGGPFSVRARVLQGSRRPTGFVDTVNAALSGSPLQPDFEALQRELATPELSVARCFVALGVPGARDFASPDVAARWEDLNSVGRALLTGQPAEKKQLKNLQEVLKPFSAAKLPAKGKLGKGETARMLAEVAVELRGALGIPESGAWAERFRAAACYWDICDGEALERLTAGTDKAGIGTGASVARLLAHFPEGLLRDPLFLAVLALECEAANGHAYVEGLCKLAEQTTKAGLVLVVAPAEQRAAMRKAFGVDPGTAEGAGPGSTLCGEALISGTTITKGDVAQSARAWVTKAKATGVIAELPADGPPAVAWFREGAPAKDAKETGLGPVDNAALRQAAERFLPRKGFIALGAGDLLAPGVWRQGSYSGEGPTGGADDHRAKKRRHANALLDPAAEPQALNDPCDLLSVLGSSLRYTGPLSETDGGIVSLRFVPPGADQVWARDLRNDLKGQSVIHLYGEAWVHGSEVRGYTCSDLDVALLAQLLGDAPAGTVIAVGRGADLMGVWRF